MANGLGRYWKKLRSTLGSEGTGEGQEMVTIVSGLPRSGTSMMMKMLEAGGIPPLTDEIRTPDPDNPKGYYEFERVKQLNKGDTAWVGTARGKAVKVIAALLEHLPAQYRYKVIFMRRNMDEILNSQKRMLVRRGESAEQVDDEEMSALFQKHLDHITGWLNAQPNFEVLFVSYNDMVSDPTPQVERIQGFLGRDLDLAQMVGIVDPKLYRQRQ